MLALVTGAVYGYQDNRSTLLHLSLCTRPRCCYSNAISICRARGAYTVAMATLSRSRGLLRKHRLFLFSVLWLASAQQALGISQILLALCTVRHTLLKPSGGGQRLRGG